MNPLLQPGLHGAFVAEGHGALPAGATAAASPGPLMGLSLAVKDVFEVQGLVCGAGNPQWHADARQGTRTAWAVQTLMTAGCRWIGKTVTDELTYSLAGINRHYGTPVNPRAPERLPGGSSSGSAVAVAAGHADIALGTDCGGSVRLPASYCGIWGIRPSHGRVASNGCFSLAHSLDTIGWFSRDGETLGRVLEQLLGTRLEEQGGATLLVSDDASAQLDPAVRQRFERWLEASTLAYERLPQGTLPLQAWAGALRVLQAAEVWQQHGAWVTARQPVFGEDVAGRFQISSQVTAAQVAKAVAVRNAAQAQLAALFATGRMLLLPPVPGESPRLDSAADTLQEIRTRSQRLLCMAGLAGLPQVVMPWSGSSGAPVGLSLLGGRFADETVLAHARDLYRTHILPFAGNL